jgi:hypothetical protein
VLASRPYHLTEMVVVPALAIVLLLTSFVTQVSVHVKSAAIILVVVAVQTLLTLVDSDAPEVATAHVLAAFVLFAVAVQASRRITPELRPGRTVH